MKEINNIDELLKDSFSHFEATPPPDAWSGIQQGLQGTPAGAGNTLAGAKSVSVIAKVVIGAVIAVTTATAAYMLYNQSADKAVSGATTAVLPDAGPSEIAAHELKAVDAKVAEVVQQAEPISKTPVIERHQKSRAVMQEPTSPTTTGSQEPASPAAVMVAPPTKPVEKMAEANKAATPPADAARPKPRPKHSFDNPKNPAESSSAPSQVFDKPKAPNVFTPDGDGENDRFNVEIENEILFELKIYDANGKVVFESTDKNRTWDGTDFQSGEPCAAQWYRYALRYQYRGQTEPHTKGGDINLIR